jgi:GT2 family glycosyltransferase
MSQVLAAPPEPRLTRPAAPDVSVCIANWNCAELLRRCLQSLVRQPQGVRVEVIVADNGSTDGAADMVAAEFPTWRSSATATTAGSPRPATRRPRPPAAGSCSS